jgi:putative ABC transport system permease protein
MDWLRLAFKYIAFHRWKSLILTACIFLTAFLPLAIELLLTRFEQGIADRSERTPLVVGPVGSRFDLTLRALYFRTDRQELSGADTCEFRQVAEINGSGLAKAIPIYCRHTAGGSPVIGTSLDYFSFRGLSVAEGGGLVRIGDCLLGGAAAKKLGLRSGDSLITDLQNVLSITAAPMKLRVRGVLSRNHSADDWGVFVDMKTAWIVDGIGHGHQNLETVEEDKLLSRDQSKIVASAAVLPFTEVTDENVSSFHFHGDSAGFPISAVIAIPRDEKSETILIGRYLHRDQGLQLVVPRLVIRELMSLVFQVKRFFDANAILVAVSTALLLALIVVLSVRLREREMDTMFRMGASRNTITMLLIGEIGIVFGFALLWIGLAMALLNYYAEPIVRSLLLQS